MAGMNASLGLRNSSFTADRLPSARARVEPHENCLPVWIRKAGGGEVSVVGGKGCVWHPAIQVQVTVVGYQQSFHAPRC